MTFGRKISLIENNMLRDKQVMRLEVIKDITLSTIFESKKNGFSSPGVKFCNVSLQSCGKTQGVKHFQMNNNRKSFKKYLIGRFGLKERTRDPINQMDNMLNTKIS